MKNVNLGVDIAKDWFDACILIENSRYVKKFANSAAGFARFRDWVHSFECDRYNLVFEPTGRYGEALVTFILELPKIRVVRADIRRFRRFAQSLQPDLKSDYSDAFALAMFAKERSANCPEHRLPSPIQLELRDIQMCLRSLEKRSVAVQNQLKCGLRSDAVRHVLSAEAERINAEYDEIFALACSRIDADLALREDKRLLLSIPGIGEKTAIILLSLIDFRKFPTSRSLAKFLGLTPRKWESGSSIKARGSISKAGNKYVRNALLFPAMAAMQHNAVLRPFCERLTSAGKPGALVRTAVIRKLVTIAWSLIHNRRPFSEEFETA
ncbi:MAG: IS110 family transposase [Candidatus Obscuribacterales bacterium]